MTDEQIIAAAGEPVAYADALGNVITKATKKFSRNVMTNTFESPLYTADAIISAVKPLRDRIAELEANASMMKAYYERVFEDGGKRIAEITNQRDRLLDALTKIAETNASKHGTTGMMLERCTEIARSAIAVHKNGGAA